MPGPQKCDLLLLQPPMGRFAGRSLQTPRKPKLTSRHVRSRSAPGRLTWHPPHHALTHQDLLTQHQPGDFTGTSRFPAGKGPVTPLFTEGLLSAHGRGKPCPNEQTRDRNKPPHFLPVAEVSSPAQGLFFFFPPFFFLMKTPSKNSFFYRKRAAGRCFHRVPPCSGREWRGCGPNGGFGDRHSPFWGVFPPILRGVGLQA